MIIQFIKVKVGDMSAKEFAKIQDAGGIISRNDSLSFEVDENEGKVSFVAEIFVPLGGETINVLTAIGIIR